jgi:phosphoglycolate phosphatase
MSRDHLARFDLLIFDLDGTLIDSKVDLANSMNFTRQQMALSALEHQLIYSYIGDGAAMLIRRAMGEGLGEADILRALAIFLSHYREHLLDNTILFPGVADTLDSLCHLKLAVLTNKPIELSQAILQGLGVLEKFLLVRGGNSFEQKKPHPMGIEWILQETRTSSGRALIVGDSRIDIQTGRNAGVPTCGVTYGFATDTLRDPKPDFLIDRFEQLRDIVFGAT